MQYHGKHTVSELLGAAYEGWLNAVQRFDSRRKIRFHTYAEFRIVGQIRDYIRSLKMFRKHQTHCIQNIDHGSVWTSSHYEAIAKNDLLEKANGMIARLPERQSVAIRLYFFEEMKLREIGELLGVTESAVSLIKTRAINNLRDMANPV